MTRPASILVDEFMLPVEVTVPRPQEHDDNHPYEMATPGRSATGNLIARANELCITHFAAICYRDFPVRNSNMLPSLLDHWLRSSVPKGSTHEMKVSEEKSAKPNNRVPRWEGGLADIEIAVLIPLMLVANAVVATIAWYVVGSLLR